MAQRRVGAGTSRVLAGSPSLDAALSGLRESFYAQQLHGVVGLAAAERAVRETVLWQLRVVAGWLPATGTGMARAVAGTFEIENIVALAHQFDGGPRAPEPFQMGALGTAWHRLESTTSAGDLAAALHTTSWGDGSGGTPAALGPGMLGTVLRVVWARRLAAMAPPARPWCGALCVLTAARCVGDGGVTAPPQLLHLLRPVLGRSWESAGSLGDFRAALSPSLHMVLRDLASPRELWRAEARIHFDVEKDAFGLLRHSMPGPDVVLGAMMVLSMDAWRVRAALAAAAAGAGASEVLDEAA